VFSLVQPLSGCAIQYAVAVAGTNGDSMRKETSVTDPYGSTFGYDQIGSLPGHTVPDENPGIVASYVDFSAQITSMAYGDLVSIPHDFQRKRGEIAVSAMHDVTFPTAGGKKCGLARSFIESQQYGARDIVVFAH
jgi:hypothetical protein